MLLVTGASLAAQSASRPASVPATRGALAATLQARLDAAHAAGRFPGATLGMALADGTTLALATGVVDRATKVPMPKDARMLAGSVGKTLFAALALLQVEDGLLALDAKVAAHLEDRAWFSRLPNAGDLTVRMLMTHATGLERYEFKPAFTKALSERPERVWKPEELLGYVLDDEPLFPAGQRFAYSDTNYIVLGLVLEKLGKAPLYEQIQRRILEPLRITDLVPSDSRRIERLAQGHAGPANAFGGRDAMLEDGVLAINPQFEGAGGGYAATAVALARWAKSLYEGEVVPKARIAEAVRGIDAPGLGRGVRYGLGVIVRDTPLGECWGHSGWFPGWVTELAYWPRLRVAVALQVNSSVAGAFGRSPHAFLVEVARVVGG